MTREKINRALELLTMDTDGEISDGETRELIELMADIKNWLVIDEI